MASNEMMLLNVRADLIVWSDTRVETPMPELWEALGKPRAIGT